jgi:hypothetical protein
VTDVQLNHPRKDKKWKAKDYPQTEGIDVNEVQRRKAAGECLHCAWLSDRKGNHSVKDCIRPIELDKGTAGYPKAKWLAMLTSSSEEDSSGEE